MVCSYLMTSDATGRKKCRISHYGIRGGLCPFPGKLCREVTPEMIAEYVAKYG